MAFVELSYTAEELETILARAETSARVFYTDTEPTSGMNTNDVWITITTSLTYVYSGSAWVLLVPSYTAEVVFQPTPPTSGKIWIDSNLHLHVWNATNEQWVQI